MPQITEDTITDRETVLDDLETIRERGYSFNNQENIEGLRAVGVAVKGEDESVLGL
jgi:DNA-binding IclR family transcriptional regulator